VACLFDTEAGPMALVLVGAMVVGSVETVWSGVVAPGNGLVTTTRYEGDQAVSFSKGEEMGRFRLGSTVVMVMPKGSVRWNPEQKAGKAVRMGEAFGTLA